MIEKKKRLQWSNAWRDARGVIWSHRYRLALGLLLTFLNRILGLVLPASTKYLVDNVIGKQQGGLLMVLAAVVGAAALLQAATAFALSQLLGVAAQRVITEIRKSVQAHVARLPIRYFDSTETGVLISRIMSDAEGVRSLVGSGLVQLAGGLVTATVALGVILYLNWRLTVITLLALSVFGGVLALALSRLRPLFRERGKINAEVTGRLAQSLGGIRIVKAYSAEKRETLAFARGAHKLLRNIVRSITRSSALNAFASVTIGVIGIIIMVVGGRAVLSGAMTLGDLIMYTFFTAMVAAPLMEISGVGTQISEALAGLDRIGEIKRMALEDEGDERLGPLDSVRGDVAFEDVSFEYAPGVPVLKHVSFYAPAGSTTALVGASGSGKSTLISLVMALYRPARGVVRVDHRDLASIRMRDYRRHLGVVLQDNFLFDGSIASNIRCSAPRASREQVRAAARIAHCEEFIARFPEKYDTVVGERGVRLSGGQRQRVAIARAILADPKILILDEATSSLDSESEAMIQEGLRALRRGRTTFVIAHRLSTVEGADQILVLDEGEIVERGTHEELLAAAGRYKQLYERQFEMQRDKFLDPGEDFAAGPLALANS